jgi:hypothetical protein
VEFYLYIFVCSCCVIIVKTVFLSLLSDVEVRCAMFKGLLLISHCLIFRFFYGEEYLVATPGRLR